MTNDKWIMKGVDDGDIVWHYAGWCAFRISEWHFPLGLADTMGGGTYITYTDSIPWFAIIFKLFLQIINYNGTFQYFGIYTLLCYILQAIGTGLLIRRKTSSHFAILFCMLLLCFSPVLMERALRHTALAAQWFILFAMYAYLKFLDRNCKGFPISFGLLAFLAVGIHPYFLPMILIFSLISLLSALYRRTNVLSNIWGFVYSISLPVAGGMAIGALGTGISPSRWGFGYFGMNLNAIFNPTSLGGYNWSVFLKVHPQILGNWDGFNYLGLGYAFLIAIAVISFIVKLPKRNGVKIFDAAAYIFACAFMTAFAVSNVVTFNDKTLVTIPFSDKLVNLCNIFRASSRMFYFTYYSLVIFSLYRIYDVLINLNQKWGNLPVISLSRAKSFCVLVCVVLFLQLLDVSQTVIKKHSDMADKLKYESIIDDQNLADAVKGKRYLISVVSDYILNRQLSVFAGKNNISTSFSVAMSGDYSAEAAKANKILDEFIFGRHTDDLVLAYSDISFAKLLYQNERIKSTCRYIESNGFAFIIAQKNTMNNERDPNEFTALALTNQDWTRGIHNNGVLILFGYSEELRNVLNSGVKYVSVNGNKAGITRVDVLGTTWIWVWIDKKAQDYAFPNVIRFTKK